MLLGSKIKHLGVLGVVSSALVLVACSGGSNGKDGAKGEQGAAAPGNFGGAEEGSVVTAPGGILPLIAVNMVSDVACEDVLELHADVPGSELETFKLLSLSTALPIVPAFLMDGTAFTPAPLSVGYVFNPSGVTFAVQGVGPALAALAPAIQNPGSIITFSSVHTFNPASGGSISNSIAVRGSCTVRDSGQKLANSFTAPVLAAAAVPANTYPNLTGAATDKYVQLRLTPTADLIDLPLKRIIASGAAPAGGITTWYGQEAPIAGRAFNILASPMTIPQQVAVAYNLPIMDFSQYCGNTTAVITLRAHYGPKLPTERDGYSAAGVTYTCLGR